MKRNLKDQLRQKGISELILDLSKKNGNLVELKFKLAQGQLKDTRSIYRLKKEIAVVMTIISEKKHSKEADSVKKANNSLKVES